MPRPDRDETDFEYGCGLSLGLISPITSSRPGHTRVSPKVHAHKGIWGPPAGGRTCTPSSELRHCTAYPEFFRKPLGLNP
jgi:hypothetical protein